ncbi:MAG: LytTR family transcriptional regulator DNA-binding domain-containing protein [Flavobacteriaceae bacterium]|nr:LytTR family transcriptional regulator DNA-binding domain-containing protein [Flavobacteriaceae bacterium]
MRKSFKGLCFKAFVFTIVLYSYFSYGQEYNFINYNVENGLPSSEIYRVFQDENGLLWFITDKGVCYYDGYDFSTEMTDEKLFGTVVIDYFITDNHIWFVTMSKGLFKYNLRDKSVVPYPYNGKLKQIVKANVILDLYVSDEEDVYITIREHTGYLKLSAKGGVENYTSIIHTKVGLEMVSAIDQCGRAFSFMDLTNQKSPIPKITKRKLILNGSYLDLYEAIVIDDKHTLVHNGLKVVLFQNDREYKEFNYKNRIVRSGIFGKDSFWVSIYDEGVYVYNLKGELQIHFLEGESISDITFDHESGFWASSLRGGSYYFKDIRIKSFFQYKDIVQRITSLTKDNDNNLYIGYIDGCVYKKAISGNLELIYESSNSKPSYVQYNAAFNDILIHNDGMNFFLNKSDSPINTGYTVGLTDDEHNYPIAINYRGYSKLISPKSIEKSELFRSRIYDAQESDAGCFIATSEGIYHKNGGIETLLDNDPLYSLRVNDIDEANNALYGASQGKGVLRFNNKKIRSINRSDGLFNNIVKEIYIEDSTTVWACTNSGLNRLIFKGEELIQLDGISSVDGLISDEVIDIEILNDSVWVGTRKGLSVFPKEILNQKNESGNDKFFKITSLKVNENTVRNLKNLKYNQNRLKISYTGISFKNSGQLEYRHKLEGLEQNWNQTNNREILYSSVPPGEFKLIIQIREKNKKWLVNQQIQLPVQIHQAFWKTPWFIITTIAFVSLLIYLFFKIRVLSYNEDIIRELLRTLMKKVKAKEQSILVKVDGKETKIITSEIHYIKSSGNYIEIVTREKLYLSRDNIKHFLEKLPDKLEFIRIHRSYVIRIDKVRQKNSKTVVVLDEEIPVGKTYRKEIEKIFLG